MSIKYNKHRNIYVIKSDYIAVDAKKLSDNEMVSLYLKRYIDIFPKYDKTKHIVTIQNNHIANWATLQETSGDDKPLPFGSYFVRYNTGWDIIMQPMSLDTDDYVELDESSNILRDDINMFIDNSDQYEKLGMKHRRGALLYGDPGTGKTISISNCVNQLKDVYIFILKGNVEFGDLLTLRDNITGNAIFILEELTDRVKGEEGEELLSFLDGELSWHDTYTIATTNYPSKLNKNIVDRPGRFDLLIKYEVPNRDKRKKYLSSFADISNEILDSTDGYSIGYLKEIVTRSMLYDKDMVDVIKELEKTKKIIEKSFTGKGNLGF